MIKYGRLNIVKLEYSLKDGDGSRKYWYWEYTDLRDARHKLDELDEASSSDEPYPLGRGILVSKETMHAVSLITEFIPFDTSKPNEKWIDFYNKDHKAMKT